jgi:hypothetical protein
VSEHFTLTLNQHPKMKLKKQIRLVICWAAALLLSTINQQLSTCFAQGSLTPPGAPAPTMKTLQQIEPRTPISGPLPLTISSAGSYYLTTNLTGVAGTNGITIVANNVTLDLNGFTLQGVLLASWTGLYVSGTRTNITVRNGTISGWGQHGVFAGTFANLSENIVFERLTVSANSGMGIGGAGCAVRNCEASINGSYGIYVAPGVVSGCFVLRNGQSGIYIDGAGSEIIGNTCKGNNATGDAGNAGIYINNNNNRIEANHVTDSGYAGIRVAPSSINNIIIKNSVIGNGVNNYVTPNVQVVGPLITTTGTITNSNPWANFSF